MLLWNARLLIGCKPRRDLRFEIFLKLNSTLHSRAQVKFSAASQTANSSRKKRSFRELAR
jgi:hypothetical protein